MSSCASFMCSKSHTKCTVYLKKQTGANFNHAVINGAPPGRHNLQHTRQMWLRCLDKLCQYVQAHIQYPVLHGLHREGPLTSRHLEEVKAESEGSRFTQGAGYCRGCSVEFYLNGTETKALLQTWGAPLWDPFLGPSDKRQVLLWHIKDLLWAGDRSPSSLNGR